MPHWAEKYIGREYIHGEYDCAVLALEVLKNDFNMNIELPKERADSWFALSEIIEKNKEYYGEKTDEPIEGDAVLMKARGRLNHIGMYATINNVPYVLHNMANVGSVCLHRIQDLDKYNLIIEGFYKFKQNND